MSPDSYRSVDKAAAQLLVRERYRVRFLHIAAAWPESALREGPNRVEVLALYEVGGKLRLTRLGPFDDSGE